MKEQPHLCDHFKMLQPFIIYIAETFSEKNLVGKTSFCWQKRFHCTFVLWKICEYSRIPCKETFYQQVRSYLIQILLISLLYEYAIIWPYLLFLRGQIYKCVNLFVTGFYVRLLKILLLKLESPIKLKARNLIYQIKWVLYFTFLFSIKTATYKYEMIPIFSISYLLTTV